MAVEAAPLWPASLMVTVTDSAREGNTSIGGAAGGAAVVRSAPRRAGVRGAICDKAGRGLIEDRRVVVSAKYLT